MTRSLKSLLAVAAIALTASTASAQTSCNTNGCSLTNTISSIVPAVVKLNITTNATSLSTPTDVNFGISGTPGTATSDAGPTLSVKANRSWTLAVNSPATFTPSNGSSYNKPAGDVQVVSGATTVTLSAASQTIASGSATGNGSHAMTYLTSYDWTLDTPGTYSLAVAYTLTAP